MKKYFLPILSFFVIGLSTCVDAQPYYGVSVGGTYLTVSDMKEITFRMKDDGFCLNLCQGYDFPTVPIRFEQQFCFSKHYFDSDTIWSVNHYKKDLALYSFSLIENIFVDLELENFIPYVGIGAGYHCSKGRGMNWDIGNYWYKYKMKMKKFIFQSTFGIRVPINQLLDVSIEYQFRTHKNDTFREHGLTTGLKVFL